jgi:putative transcriptional regulator
MMWGMESLQGKLLIAGAGLFDPNFRRTIILIGNHDEEGAVGVVLNRASEVAVREAVPPLGDLVEPEERLFFGGPVQPESAVILAEFEDPGVADVLAFDSIGFLPAETGPEEVTGLVRVRVFAGYAGWGAGQLEAEMQEGSWIVEPAVPEDVFTAEPEMLWNRVLRRKGRAFEMLRLMPFDPSLN